MRLPCLPMSRTASSPNGRSTRRRSWPRESTIRERKQYVHQLDALEARAGLLTYSADSRYPGAPLCLCEAFFMSALQHCTVCTNPPCNANQCKPMQTSANQCNQAGFHASKACSLLHHSPGAMLTVLRKHGKPVSARYASPSIVESANVLLFRMKTVPVTFIPRPSIRRHAPFVSARLVRNQTWPVGLAQLTRLTVPRSAAPGTTWKLTSING